MKKSNWGEFSLKKIMNVPDMITFLNIVFGILTIYLAIEKEFFWSSIAMLIAVVMDYLDGKTANLLGQKTEFGKNIDSLADLVSFGVAPAIFGYVYYTNSIRIDPLIIIGTIFFVICGLIRLARYNIISYKNGFMGMPITVNGIVFPIFYFISIPTIIFPYLFIVSGILMISSFTFRRIL
jgi:CDP-diacylglycerol---serine O-phosphatidyltransferase